MNRDTYNNAGAEELAAKGNKKKIAVIVQCRLSSTRLDGKGLLPLAGKPLLAWTLDALRKVPADFYYVATDFDSFDRLLPVAEKCGWQIFAGPLENVLERFCQLVKKIGADTVVRATADNPFLFYEAASGLLGEFLRQYESHALPEACAPGRKPDNSIDNKEIDKCDYMTYTGLPHGSGVEVFDARSLLRAAGLTSEPYDTEHVGPALYNHPQNFRSVFLPAPERFCLPESRTTVDTERDFRRAQQIADLVFAARKASAGKADGGPFAAEEIASALRLPQVARPILFFPSAKKGCGTGHLRRCLSLAAELGATVFIPSDATLPETKSLVADARQRGLADWQVTSAFPNKDEYSLIVADAFSLSEGTAQRLSAAAQLCAVDEGGDFSAYADYLLDIIPSLSAEDRPSNFACPGFMELPQNTAARKEVPQTVLVCFGGEDPSSLTVPVAKKFASLGFEVTAICANAALCQKEGGDAEKKISYTGTVQNLREEIFRYDIVATHYGLTAYEARAAGCTVITFATTKLHQRLSEKYGFACLGLEELGTEKIFLLHSEFSKSYENEKQQINLIEGKKNKNSLAQFLERVSFGRKIGCPVCEQATRQPSGKTAVAAAEVVARTESRTFRRCRQCGIVYMAWTEDTSHRQYSASYFADEYKAQYGKTYLEDFDSIKAQCVRRMANISALLGDSPAETSGGKKSVLDIGCAYGAFLAAAADRNWLCYGTDIAADAVEYVKSTLGFPAVTAAFPNMDTQVAFGGAAEQFDAVTMWFVIEHFSELSCVLQKVSALTKNGGVFAFSTPSGEGVSAKHNRQHFFEQSPADHYTIWEPSRAAAVLEKFGFAIEKVVSTGHHAERFPEVKANGWEKGSAEFERWTDFSVKNNLGDTFEVYCRKVRG